MVDTRVIAQQVGISQSDLMREALASIHTELRELRSGISKQLGIKSSRSRKSNEIEHIVNDVLKKQSTDKKSVDEIVTDLINTFNKKRQTDKDEFKSEINASISIFHQKYTSSLTNGLRNTGADIIGSLKADSKESSRNNYEDVATASSNKTYTSAFNGLLGGIQKLLIPDKISKTSDNGNNNPNHSLKSVDTSTLSTSRSTTSDRENLLKVLSKLKENDKSDKQKTKLIDNVISQLGSSDKNSIEETKLKIKTVKELSENKQQDYYDKKNEEKDKVLSDVASKIAIGREKYTKSLSSGIRNLTADGIGMLKADSNQTVRNNYEEAATESSNNTYTKAFNGSLNFGQKTLQTRYPSGQHKDEGQDNPNHNNIRKIIDNGNEPIKKSIYKLDRYVRNDLVDDIMEELRKLNKKKKMEDDIDNSSTSRSMTSGGTSNNSNNDVDSGIEGESGFGIGDMYDMYSNAKHLMSGKGSAISNIWRRSKLALRGSKMGRGAQMAKKFGSRGMDIGKKSLGFFGKGSGLAKSSVGALGKMGSFAGKAMPLLGLAQVGYGAYKTGFDKDSRTSEASRLAQKGIGGRVADTLGIGNVGENFSDGVMSGVGKTALDVLSAPVQWGKNIGTAGGLISDIVGSKNDKKNTEKSSDDRISNMNGDGYDDAVSRFKNAKPGGKETSADVASAAGVSQALRMMSIGPAMSVSQSNGNISKLGDQITSMLSSASTELSIDLNTGKIGSANAKLSLEKLKGVSKLWATVRSSIKNGSSPGTNIDEKILSKGDDMYMTLLPLRIKTLEEYISNLDKNPTENVEAKNNIKPSLSSPPITTAAGIPPTVTKTPTPSIVQITKPPIIDNKPKPKTPIKSPSDTANDRFGDLDNALETGVMKPPEGYREVTPADRVKANVGKIQSTTQPAANVASADIKEAVTSQNKAITDQLVTLTKQMIILTEKKPVMIPQTPRHNNDASFGYIGAINQGA